MNGNEITKKYTFEYFLNDERYFEIVRNNCYKNHNFQIFSRNPILLLSQQRYLFSCLFETLKVKQRVDCLEKKRVIFYFTSSHALF